MALISYACSGYKPFAEKAEITISPLTLIFGHNSTGKSALLRLPLLLLRAMSTQARVDFPLEVDGLEFGTEFLDLVHGHNPAGQIEFEVSIQDGSDRFEFLVAVQNLTEATRGSHRAVVSRLRLVIDDNPIFDIEWEPSASQVTSYRRGGQPAEPISFRGILPAAAANEPQIARLRQAAATIEDGIVYIGPRRADVRLSYTTHRDVPLDPDGAGAPHWLRESQALEDAVGQWYQAHLGGARLRVNVEASSFQLGLARSGWSDALAYSGDGSQHVLPIVVQQFHQRLFGGESVLSIVEQPELHLHDAAQGALADLFVETAVGGKGRAVVETHSEIFLLRVRRCIAQGKISPTDVAIYWVQDDSRGKSTLQRVQVDEHGEVANWPQGVYAETFNEAAALRRAGRGRVAGG